MQTKIRKLAAMLAIAALAAAFTAPTATAGDPVKGGKCNSGGGNGRETTPADD